MDTLESLLGGVSAEEFAANMATERAAAIHNARRYNPEIQKKWQSLTVMTDDMAHADQQAAISLQISINDRISDELVRLIHEDIVGSKLPDLSRIAKAHPEEIAVYRAALEMTKLMHREDTEAVGKLLIQLDLSTPPASQTHKSTLPLIAEELLAAQLHSINKLAAAIGRGEFNDKTPDEVRDALTVIRKAASMDSRKEDAEVAYSALRKVVPGMGMRMKLAQYFTEHPNARIQIEAQAASIRELLGNSGKKSVAIPDVIKMRDILRDLPETPLRPVDIAHDITQEKIDATRSQLEALSEAANKNNTKRWGGSMGSAFAVQQLERLMKAPRAADLDIPRD